MGILHEIVAYKREFVEGLYEQYNLQDLRRTVVPCSKNFYTALEALPSDEKFLIAEFKRRSPSAGAINESVDLATQVAAYQKAGANAISVLTDEQFFGGSYADLKEASQLCEDKNTLVLNKEFIIDPIQVYLARANGADLVLLIASILKADELKLLKNLAERLGMGVLMEVHNEAEYRKIQDLGCQVIGINNRNLDTFSVALNTTNYLKQLVDAPYVIAESGIYNQLDISVLDKGIKGYLVGTSLMQGGNAKMLKTRNKRLFFKACGLRRFADLKLAKSDLVGINFSPLSKRKIVEKQLDNYNFKGNEVAVFYGNEESEIEAVLNKYPFSYAQLYADKVNAKQLSNLKCKVILAIKVRADFDYKTYEPLIQKSDLVILDGAVPGSGEAFENSLIPADFPYSFLLAGGMNEGNLERSLAHPNCIGIDMASGIESEGQVSIEKVNLIRSKLESLTVSHLEVVG